MTYQNKINGNYKIKVICFFVVLLSFCLSLELSSSDFGLNDFLRIILEKFKDEQLSNELQTVWVILFDVRLPRVLLAALCGGAMGISGVLSQGLFRNPLASPSLVGSSSGALLGGVFCFYLGVSSSHFLALTFFAILGSFVTTFFLLLLYSRFQEGGVSKLLLVGLSFSTLASALSTLLISLEDRDPYKSTAIYRWFLGGFYHASWSHVLLVFFPVMLGLFFCSKVAPKLDLLSLGDDTAKSLGLDLKKIKISLLLLISLLLGLVTSVAGAVPFVGLVVPHMTRSLLGPSHKNLMIFSFINSASLVLLSDMIAKKALAHKELELSIVLSLLGAPFFIYLLLRKAKV